MQEQPTDFDHDMEPTSLTPQVSSLQISDSNRHVPPETFGLEITDGQETLTLITTVHDLAKLVQDQIVARPVEKLKELNQTIANNIEMIRHVFLRDNKLKL